MADADTRPDPAEAAQSSPPVDLHALARVLAAAIGHAAPRPEPISHADIHRAVTDLTGEVRAVGASSDERHKALRDLVADGFARGARRMDAIEGRVATHETRLDQVDLAAAHATGRAAGRGEIGQSLARLAGAAARVRAALVFVAALAAYALTWLSPASHAGPETAEHDRLVSALRAYAPTAQPSP